MIDGAVVVWSLVPIQLTKGASAMNTTTSKTSGFTLVELAIVLVIIGLIIGGVLVGQDLIKAATIRSTVSDFEKFNAGATTFRGKFDGLPGDLTAARAVEFTFSPATTGNATGAVGFRDGNGIIEGGAANSNTVNGETALFWQDLGTSGFIAGTYPGIGVTATAPALTAANIGTFLPHSKLRDTASYYVYSNVGRNFYYLGALAQAAGGPLTSTPAVTPLEAKGIDDKIDDGYPTTGVVISLTAGSGSAVPTGGALNTPDAGITKTSTTCMDGTTAIKTYNSDPANNGGINCLLQLRTAF